MPLRSLAYFGEMPLSCACAVCCTPARAQIYRDEIATHAIGRCRLHRQMDWSTAHALSCPRPRFCWRQLLFCLLYALPRLDCHFSHRYSHTLCALYNFTTLQEGLALTPLALWAYGGAILIMAAVLYLLLTPDTKMRVSRPQLMPFTTCEALWTNTLLYIIVVLCPCRKT